MRILIAHNSYKQAGGEDTVFANETALLRRAGHDVETLAVSNDAIALWTDRLKTAVTASYNPQGRALMTDRIKRFRPEVVHVHNFFPRLSPAIFDACGQASVPVVWTLHNFRVTCANALLLRDSRPCEECLGKVPLAAVRHRCYRGSTLASLSLASMIWTNRLRGTWRSRIDRFIALTDFARNKFIAAGLPADRIRVKPNFADDPFGTDGAKVGEPRTGGALFVGRLSAEKGADVLVAAWQDLDFPLTVMGDGPERSALEAAAPPHVRFMGHCEKASVQREMRQAALLIVPSIWYEMFPMTVVEAMACGTPVIASRIGALAEIIEDGRTGYHFNPSDPSDLVRVVRMALSDPARLAEIGANARAHFEARLSPAASLGMLETIYAEVCER